MPGSRWPIILRVEDPEGREIGLNEEAWRHIRETHPGITIEKIQTTIEDPHFIMLNETHGSLNYLRMVPERRMFRLAAVKEFPGRNPRFEVSTAYPVAIPPLGKIVWRKQ